MCGIAHCNKDENRVGEHKVVPTLARAQLHTIFDATIAMILDQSSALIHLYFQTVRELTRVKKLLFGE